MNIPIERHDLVRIVFRIPYELKSFRTTILDFKHEVHFAWRNLESYNNLNDIVKSMLDVMSLLDTLTWEFLALIRKSSEGKAEEKSFVDTLEQDLTVIMSHIKMTLETTFTAPDEQLSYQRLAYLLQTLTVPFNSLIGLVVIDASENAKLNINEILQGEKRVDKEKFYSELLKSCKIHAGVFKKHLFIMTKGKIQQAYVPRPPADYKAVAVEKTKEEDAFTQIFGESGDPFSEGGQE